MAANGAYEKQEKGRALNDKAKAPWQEPASSFSFTEQKMRQRQIDKLQIRLMLAVISIYPRTYSHSWETKNLAEKKTCIKNRCARLTQWPWYALLGSWNSVRQTERGAERTPEGKQAENTL